MGEQILSELEQHQQSQIREYSACIKKIQAVVEGVLGKGTRWQDFDVLPSGVAEVANGAYQRGIDAMKVHLEECLSGRMEPTNPTMQLLLDWR